MKKNGSNGNGNGVKLKKGKKAALVYLHKIIWDLYFKTDNQKVFYDKMENHDITFCFGPAGTGKTYLSMFYALKLLADKTNNIEGLILCRPLISIDNESIGYLPGELEDKVDPYMMSYWQTIEKIIGLPALELLLASKVIKVIPLAFFRGLTLDNRIIIYDEAQNSTTTAMKSFLTRIGEKSKMVVMGDINQTDRKNGSS